MPEPENNQLETMKAQVQNLTAQLEKMGVELLREQNARLKAEAENISKKDNTENEKAYKALSEIGKQEKADPYMKRLERSPNPIAQTIFRTGNFVE